MGRANFVSCDDIIASFLLEMNDIWNIHNTNIWHFSSFMNPELEILFCFLGRLQGIADIGNVTLAAKLSLIFGVSWKNWVYPLALRPSSFKHEQGSATQICGAQRENASGERCQRWQLRLAPRTTGLGDRLRWVAAGLSLLGFCKAAVWSEASKCPYTESLPSLCYQNQKLCLLACCVFAHACFSYLQWV